MTDLTDLQDLVDAADTNALLIAVDRLASSREWGAMADLSRRCLEAVEFGRQLWPVAMHIDYRLAWEAPAAYAAAVLRPGAARFALGPLTEVAASTHDWASLAPHLNDPVSAVAVAQERVIRGEDLRGREDVAIGADEGPPLALAPWEPAYALPRYRDRSAAFPQPEIALRPTGAPHPLRGRTAALSDDAAVEALRETVETWVSQSAGSVAGVMVEGDAAGAVATLLQARTAAPRAALLPVGAADALAVLQWAGASGGAYGRRPGGARGRFAAWWTAAALTGLPWPPDPDELGRALAELRWFRWAAEGAEVGWILRVTIEDPVDGLAWAVEGLDARREDDEPPELDTAPEP